MTWQTARLGYIIGVVLASTFVLTAAITLAWAFISVGPWSVVALTCTLIVSAAIVRRDANTPHAHQSQERRR